MLFSEIALVLEGDLLQMKKDTLISALAFDTRKLNLGGETLFFALRGNNHNGHHFLDQAYRSGVRNFVVSEKVDWSKFSEANFLNVENVLIALQKLVAHHRHQYKIPVIGITGSNGKTIVKEWLSDLLSEKFSVAKSPKSFNSQIGVPLSVWGLTSQHEIGVFEAGISKTGEMQRLANIILPTLGIFTNIGQAHNEGFNSQQEKINEKASLFQNAEKIICSKEHDAVHIILRERFGEKLFTWSLTDPESDLLFEQIESGIRCSFQNSTYLFTVSINSGYNLENVLHAIAAALLSGLSEAQINQGLKRIRAVPMRLELKRGIRDSYIVDDSYNNDLTGLSIALDYLNQQPQGRVKTVILSDIQQSGIEEESLYKQVSELLTKHGISKLVGIGEAISRNRSLFMSSASFFATTADFLSQMPVFENELILVKGARSFSLEKIVSLLEEKNHGTVLEVNFESLTHNLNTYRKKIKPETKLMVMVKAFAYGGGLSEIAHLLQYQKVDYLGVAYMDEGVELRQKGITLPIMVMNPNWDHFTIMESFGLEPEIYSLPMLRQYLVDSQNLTPIHLKIETGMNRLGFDESDIDSLIELLIQNPQVKLGGIFTHFSSSEEAQNDDYTLFQAEKFERIYLRIASALNYSPIKHALNSSGIVRWPQFQFDMVRLGIGLYGYDTSASLNSLKPISVLKSRISQVRSVRKGEHIGYSRKGLAEKDSTIAVVSIGYADGYLRKFGNGTAHMIVNGQKSPTIGNICMDMTMLDVTGLDVKEGDEVIVFGENLTIEMLAEWGETIPYEILTNVSQRVKRVFVSE